ncbi:MAG TPA: hypothetical protein VHM69_19230, partial [Rubrobacter sp.]|nr:hypothetical protein [Rubrobacter sp.]
MTEETSAQGRGEDPGGISTRTASWLAWSLCGATVLILALSLLLILHGWSMQLPNVRPPWRNQAISLIGIIGAPILGGLIASRRPNNPYGWLWLGFGLGLALQLLAKPYAAHAQLDTGSLPSPQTISHMLSLGGPLALGIAPFLFLLFPTGQLPSRRWRYLAWISALSGAVLLFLTVLFNRPDKVGGPILVIVWIVVSSIFVTIILSALSLVARYRRANGVERQQLKWFALAAVFAACYIFAQGVGLNRVMGPTLWQLFDSATNMFLYAAVGVAVLKYRLYDIDLVINRTLVYVSLTAMLVALYLAGVSTAQTTFRLLTGQEQQPQLSIVASTLVIAALFNPLRHRIQS